MNFLDVPQGRYVGSSQSRPQHQEEPPKLDALVGASVERESTRWKADGDCRALAIILPSVTLMAHGAIFIVLEAVFAESWGSSWVAVYDLFAAVASAIGLVGTVQRHRIIFTAHLLVHTLTLSLISAVLLVNVLPTAFASHIPFSSYMRQGQDFGRNVCQELDVGPGIDERWLTDCASSFGSISRAATWAAVVLMAAQWFVLVSVWDWIRHPPTDNDTEKKRVSRQEYKA